MMGASWAALPGTRPEDCLLEKPQVFLDVSGFPLFPMIRWLQQVSEMGMLPLVVTRTLSKCCQS